MSCYEVSRRLFRALGLKSVAETSGSTSANAETYCYCQCYGKPERSLSQDTAFTLTSRLIHSFASFSAMHGLVKGEKSRVEKLVTATGERGLE